MRSLGLAPDPWQVECLEAGHPRLLLNCSRQAGKSTVVALLGLAEALFVPFTQVLLVSRSLRQSSELFRIVTDFHRRLGAPLQQRRTAAELALDDFSRVVCLPCREDTIRGYSHINLLVIGEAARVPDDLYRAVRPMLAVSDGRRSNRIHAVRPPRAGGSPQPGKFRPDESGHYEPLTGRGRAASGGPRPEAWRRCLGAP